MVLRIGIFLIAVWTLRARSVATEDFKIVVQYLVNNFGVAVPDKISINKAGARSLTNFLKLFPEEAEAIVDYRDKNCAFKEWQDLKKVAGLDPAKIERKKDSIVP